MELTERQKIILTAITGMACCKCFIDFHRAVELKLGRALFTQEFTDKKLQAEIKKAFTDEFRQEFLGIIK